MPPYDRDRRGISFLWRFSSQLVVLYCGQHLGRLVILFGSEPFADGPGLIEIMQITTQKFDHFVLAQPPCNLFYFFAVITSQRE